MLALVESSTELTTAVSDGVLALVAAGCGFAVARHRRADPWRAGLWLGVFACLTAGAAAGMVAHGLELSGAVYSGLWLVIYGSLALAIGGLAVGAISAARGPAAGSRALAPALAAAGLCFAVAQWTDRFGVLVAFEATALLLAIGLYARLALRGDHPGAPTVTAGLALTALAAAVQSSSLSFTLIVPFDHNGIFHLIQIAALPLLTCGLLAGLRRGSARG